jgi:hypothetical protein
MGARIRGPVGLPVVPRAKVHQGFGIQGRRVEVVGIGTGHPLHRAGVGQVQRSAIGPRGRGIPLRNRLDVRSLRCRGMRRQRQGFLRGSVRRNAACGIHRRVDMRTVGQGDAPVAHGAGRIEFDSACERADRFRVIEAVDKSKPLIEILLCGWDSRGDRLVMGAEVRVKRDRVRRRGRHGRARAEVCRGAREQQRSCSEPADVEAPHDVPLFEPRMELIGLKASFPVKD